jgi:hypothetical protein
MERAATAKSHFVTFFSGVAKTQRPVFYNVRLPLGVKLAPTGQLCPLGGMFTPSFTLCILRSSNNSVARGQLLTT